MKAAQIGDQTQATPQEYVDAVEKMFLPDGEHFDLDLCASESNTKAPYFLSEEDDFLTYPIPTDCQLNCWINPPFRGQGRFFERAALWAQAGHRVIGLGMATPSRVWFESISKKADVFFERQRLKFLRDGEPQKNAIPVDLVLFDFHDTNHGRSRLQGWVDAMRGEIIRLEQIKEMRTSK